MRITEEIIVIGTLTSDHNLALSEIRTAIVNSKIILNPTKKGNGVKPIKNGVVAQLKKMGWTDEHPMDLAMMRSKPLDGYKRHGDLRVGFEWETGNISSSFRALMKLIKGLDENQIDLGVHVLPSRAFYNFLTDRVGNITELLPYLGSFAKIKINSTKTLIILVVEHDSLNEKAKLIPKGLDGMSLVRRKQQRG